MVNAGHTISPVVVSAYLTRPRCIPISARAPIKNNAEGNVIDIRNYPEVINIINAALNEKRVVEVKNEARRDSEPNIVVVGLSRDVLTKPKSKA